MRVHGCIDSAARLGLDGHACWGFEQRQEFTAAVLEFLTEGRRLGQRIAFIGDEPVADQRERLDALGEVGALIDSGALVLFELDTLYPGARPVDVDAQLALYAAATDASLADGYTGLRVAAHVTDLVRDPETREAHLRWECFADRALSTKPLTVLCGYRRDLLPPQLLHDLAAIHPAANADRDTVPFHLFGQDGDLALAGEIDHFSGAAFDRALGFACGPGEAPPVNLEALDFIDHRGVEILARHARPSGSGRSVRNEPPVLNRLCDLLGVQL
ncbi:MAG TPA: MEDS domain-containing protein [Solirubrobacterales bacterium]|nr:MEDS domain-containing protein [Solirubrobacterales bacterium]